MGLRQIESTLPPGFRFYPSDEELICHYLHKKVTNETLTGGTLVEVDLHTHEPWELPDIAKLTANEWYFFSFRDRKYATGLRTNRATSTGYWKATGKDRMIYNSNSHAIVGMRKTLVFYQGRAPNGAKTSWVMHEFRLENPNSPPQFCALSSDSLLHWLGSQGKEIADYVNHIELHQEDWVLCRVFYKKKGDESYTDYSAEADVADTGITGYSSQFADQPNQSNGFTNEHVTSSPGYNNPIINMGSLHFSMPDFSQETMTVNRETVGMDSKDDYYMFLLNMGVENQDLAGGGAANIEDLRTAW